MFPPALCVVGVAFGVVVGVAGDDAGWVLAGVADVESPPADGIEIVVVLVANIAPG